MLPKGRKGKLLVKWPGRRRLLAAMDAHGVATEAPQDLIQDREDPRRLVDQVFVDRVRDDDTVGLEAAPRGEDGLPGAPRGREARSPLRSRPARADFFGGAEPYVRRGNRRAPTLRCHRLQHPPHGL